MARRVESPAEYVSFYRFWSWKYVRRNPRFREIAELLHKADADIASQDIQTPTLEETLKEYEGKEFPAEGVYIDDGDVQAPELVVALAQKVDELGLDGLRDKSRLIVSDSDLLKHYLMEEFGYAYSMVSLEESTPTEILHKLIAGESLAPPVSSRGNQKGFQLVGHGKFEHGRRVVRHNDFTWEGYDALLAVDFSTSLDSLARELEYLKKIVSHLQEAEAGGRPAEVPDMSVEIEQLRIKGRKGVSFDYLAHESRAIGLWLWDYVRERYGDKNKRGAISEAVRTFCGQFDLDSLGYSLSEMSVYQKLYRKTAVCVEKAEVFALK